MCIPLGIVYELIHTIRCVYEFKWAVNIEAERIRKQTLANIHAANSVTAPLLGYKGETVPACCQPDGPSSASNVTLLNINAASSASPCCNTTAATGEPCCTSQTTATARKLQTISGTLALAQPFRFGVDFMRAAFQAIETTLGYLLMLIAMTFNTGLFIAVVAGMAIGTFVFARFRLNDAMRSCCG